MQTLTTRVSAIQTPGFGLLRFEYSCTEDPRDLMTAGFLSYAIWSRAGGAGALGMKRAQKVAEKQLKADQKEIEADAAEAQK